MIELHLLVFFNMLPQPSAVLALYTVVSKNALHPSLHHCDVMVRRPKLLFYGNMQLPDLRCVLHGPRLTDVCLVLNRLYKAAPTPCATFEWVEGAANLP